MLGRLKQLLGDLSSGPAEQDPAEAEHEVRVASASLLVAALRADFVAEESERQELVRLIAEWHSLAPEELEDLVALAEQRVDESVSLYEFTQTINEHMDLGQKKQLLTAMWRVVLADQRLDPHEEHLVRKVAGLLHIDHPDFIACKQAAREPQTD